MELVGVVVEVLFELGFCGVLGFWVFWGDFCCCVWEGCEFCVVDIVVVSVLRCFEFVLFVVWSVFGIWVFCLVYGGWSIVVSWV